MTSVSDFPPATALRRGAPVGARFSFSALATLGRVYVFFFGRVTRFARDRRLRYRRLQQVPKPMAEDAFEGELMPTIVNGDRPEEFALLPRRKPRTTFLPAGAAPPVNQLYLPT